jgi:N-hydroxyarylamine O-acetyltransferase
VTPCEARVRYGSGGAIRPRTHMVLAVACEGHEWLADVGFGGDGLLLPLPFDLGPPVSQLGRTHRIVERDVGIRVLQLERQEDWMDVYAFTLEPQLPIDYEVASWWTSTNPSSGFVQTLVAQRIAIEGSLTLRNRQLITASPQGDITAQREIADDELLTTLREIFDIDLPPGTRFRT